MIVSVYPQTPRIADRLRGQRLLVTGVTGLLAKVFVEKLLRSVPTLECIYLLVRPGSNGLTAEERVKQEVLGSSAFDRLRASLGPRFDPLFAEKIRVVSGDLAQERFGLSPEDYAALTQQVTLIVNSAAVVRFDERLDLSLSLNTLGPRRLLAFARDCNNAPFMQVSTCYVSGRRRGDIPEEIAAPTNGQHIDVNATIDEMQAVCERILAATEQDPRSRRDQLIALGMDYAHRYGWNDTYTFTKWLGEQVVNRERGDVPVVILRPAIIEGSLEEPMPGWIDGLRMADPMIIAYGRGKMPEYPAMPHLPIDIIPVDLVANAMAAALPTRNGTSELTVYQVGSSARNRVTIGEFCGYLIEAFRRYPMLDKMGHEIRTGSFKIVDHEAFRMKWEKRLQWAMACRTLLDRYKIMANWRRRISSTIAHIEQLLYYAKIYSPYTHLDCRFLDDRLRTLADTLHPEDRKAFPFDAEAIDWPDYVINRHISGLRKFVLGGTDGGQRPVPIANETKPDDKAICRARLEAQTIFDAFERVAKLCGNKAALQIRRNGKWVRYTYAEALAATGDIARRFKECGCTVGDRVALCGENGPEWGLTYLGAMRAGLTAVPLDPQMPPKEVIDCAQFAEAKLLCAGPSRFDALLSASSTCNNEHDPPLGIVRMAEPFVPLPGASHDSAPPTTPIEPDPTASILFTSGTTVAPKAVPLTHANFLAEVRSLLRVHAMGSAENYLSVLPMYHAFEFSSGFLSSLLSGGTITYVEQLKGPEIVAAMQATGTTVMMVVPRLLKLFHESIQQKVQASGSVARVVFRLLNFLSDLSGRRWGKVLFARVHRQFGGRLRMFVTGGSSLDPKLHAAFARMGFTVCEGYGLTETSPVLTVNPPGGGKPGSAGQAVPGVELEIRNANSDGVGELWARGPTVMQGYLKNPQATAEVMQDGWFRTGDLCRRDADGYYYIMGRVKDLIVTDAGKNVYPDEVEARYQTLPYVKELCVVGMPNPCGFGESVHAVILPDVAAYAGSNGSTIEQRIREAVAEISVTIPPHQRIQAIHFGDTELPKTSTMKARRGVIRSQLLKRRAGHTSFVDVESVKQSATKSAADLELTDTQRFIIQLASRVTSRPESAIHPDSSLSLDLGVDSMMKLQLVTELESSFGMKCSDEQAAAMARVSDLFAWAGHRKPAKSKVAASASWRQRLFQNQNGGRSKTDGKDGLYDRMPMPLLPARWAVRGGLALFFRSYVRVQAEGVHHIPRKGAFILAANHASHLDAGSVITAVGNRRRLWVAGAEDYFFNTQMRSWVFGRFFDAIPFDRYTEGVKGLRRCLEILKRGEGVLFFPEGTRSASGRIQEFKTGIAIMAIESNVPIIPTRIDNSYQLFRKGQRFIRPGVVRVTFGEPISLQQWNSHPTLNDSYEQCRELAQYVRSRVESQGGSTPTCSRSMVEAGT